MKKVNILLATISFLFASLLFVQCARQTRGGGTSKATIQKPFKQLVLPSETASVDASKGGRVSFANGTTIDIPPMSFVDENGQLVKGQVTLKYEQYTSTAEIIASGIPMNYDSAGTVIPFESAGMFHLTGNDDKQQQIKIADGKTLQVNMASDVAGNQFNFYVFDEEQGKWLYEGRTEPMPNKEKEVLLASIVPVVAPASPKEMRKNEPVFDLKVDYNLYPELKEFEQTLWQCAPNCSEDEKKETIQNLRKDFDNIKLELADAERSIFKLTLFSKGNPFVTSICPIIKEKDMQTAKAVYAQKYADYQKDIEAQKKAKFVADMQGNFQRSFAVAKFGTYNWDCQLKQPQAVACKVNCEFSEKIDVANLTFYLICSAEKKAVYYSYDDLKSRFALNPWQKNTLMCVVNGNKLCVASILPMDDEVMDQFMSHKTVNCAFKTLPLEVNSLSDLNGFISSL